MTGVLDTIHQDGPTRTSADVSVPRFAGVSLITRSLINITLAGSLPTLSYVYVEVSLMALISDETFHDGLKSVRGGDVGTGGV